MEINTESRIEMTGLDVSITNQTVNVTGGRFEDKPLDPVSFDLVYDPSVDVQFDLYIVEKDGNLEYHLDMTYMDYDNMAIYEGDYKLIHTLAVFICKPSGEVDHKTYRLVPRKEVEVSDGQDQTPPDTEEAT